MRTFNKILSTFLLLAFIWSATPLIAKPNSIHFINLRWEMDSRKWKALNYYIHGPQGIIKYLPEGQNVEAWSELVTMQWYEGANQGTRAYYDEFMRGLRNMWPNQRLSANILHRSNLAMIAEWWTEGDVLNKPRYGLLKIFALNGDVYVLTYTTCEPTIVPHMKKTWFNIMKQATLNYTELEREVKN